MSFRQQSVVAAMICGLVFTWTTHASAQSGGGSNLKYSSTTSVNFPNVDSNVQTLTFTNAASSKILVITSSVHDNDAACSATSIAYLIPEVIGQPGNVVVYPLNYLQLKSDTTANNCTGVWTAHWAIDIAANGLSGKALTINMEGSSFPVRNYGVDTTAQLISK